MPTSRAVTMDPAMTVWIHLPVTVMKAGKEICVIKVRIIIH